MATSLSITIPELAVFEEKWASVPLTIKTELRATLMRSAILVQGIAREEAPVKTGLLRNSIDVLSVTDTSATIGTKKNYAELVNNGTGIYGPNKSPIVPVSRKVLATRVNPGYGVKNKQGYYIIGRSSKGQQANPFFDRAKARSIPAVREEFQTLLQTIVGSLNV